MTAEHVDFRLQSGQELHARRWVVGNAESVVLCLHGVESHGEWFDEAAAALNQRGLSVYAYDRPGWGLSEGTRGHLATYAETLGQIEEVIARLRLLYEKVHLVGLSWGGLLALYAGLRRGLLFDSLTLLVPGLATRTDLSSATKAALAAYMATGRLRATVKIPIHDDWFTRRPERTAYIRDDPHRVKRISAAFCVESFKMRAFCRANLGRRRLPATTLLLAGDDEIIDNDATRALFARTDVTVREFPGAAHSLVFEVPEETAAAIAENAARAHRIEEPRRILVMGAGAVGSLLGGLLALGGHEACLVGRQAHVDAVNADGLRITLGGGGRTVRDRLRAVTDIAEAPGPFDLVVLCVKSFDTDEALAALQPVVGPETAILSLQNGTGNEAKICAALPENPVLGGAICAYLEFTGPGQVAWSDDRGGMVAGCAGGDARKAEAVWRNILPATGMETAFVSSSVSVKWSKLMLNVAFNALNAVTGLPTAEILAHPEYGTLAARALREGFAVMRARGVDPVDLPGYPVTRMARLCRLPAWIVRPVLARLTAGQTKTVSSMAQDFARKRRTTEIDDINGAVVRAGRAANVATPANEELVALVRAAREGASP